MNLLRAFLSSPNNLIMNRWPLRSPNRVRMELGMLSETWSFYPGLSPRVLKVGSRTANSPSHFRPIKSETSEVEPSPSVSKQALQVFLMQANKNHWFRRFLEGSAAFLVGRKCHSKDWVLSPLRFFGSTVLPQAVMTNDELVQRVSWIQVLTAPRMYSMAALLFHLIGVFHGSFALYLSFL